MSKISNYEMRDEIKEFANDIIDNIKSYINTDDINNEINNLDSYIHDEYDNAITFYDDCFDIIKKSGCYYGWDKFDKAPTNLVDLAWYILHDETYDYIYNELVDYINSIEK